MPPFHVVGGDDGRDGRLRAQGVPRSIIWASALAVLVLFALLVVAAVALIAMLL